MFQKIRNKLIMSSSSTYLTLLLIILIRIKLVHTYEKGAPVRICETMLPAHGEQSMTTKMPFDITLSSRYIRGTGKITIKVTSTNPSRYSLRGALFIMKKPNNKLQAFGTFDPKGSSKDLKTIDCFGKEGSGITHSHNEPKTMLSFQWNAPNDTSAEYELHATLVRDFSNFWADIKYPDKIRVSVNAPASASFASLFLPLLLLAAVTLICRSKFLLCP